MDRMREYVNGRGKHPSQYHTVRDRIADIFWLTFEGAPILGFLAMMTIYIPVKGWSIIIGGLG